MLALLTIDSAALEAALREDETADLFEDFDNDDLTTSFDAVLVQLVRLINDRDLINSGNAGLAGVRENRTFDGDPLVVQPRESIDLTLVADLDGILEGYEFSYDLWGARRLSLASMFYEWRDMRPSQPGYPGLLEMAEDVLRCVNASITDFNEFVEATR
jgi:hypothetical protein